MESDIQILMALGKLIPLGDPAPNAPKWFAAVEMIQLAADKDWLHKATKEISKHWRANVNGIRILSLCPKRSHSKLHKNAELLWRRTKNAVAATASNPNTEGSGASWNASPKATGDSP